jgi:hypothetical protein
MKKLTVPARVPRPKFEVTTEIIQKACRANKHKCMIAEAIRAAIPEATNIAVDLIGIRWSDPAKGIRYFYPTPPSAQNALVHFDMGHLIPPFTIRLKGGQIGTMTVTKGKKTKQIHNLGRRKFTATREKNGGTVLEVIGGKLPPHRVPKHPSHHSMRHFGAGDWTGDHVKGWTEYFEAQRQNVSEKISETSSENKQ